ncbi:hypothetical protein B0H13DRAFT_1654230 [Mycena leptocephala]|nr:hypothetical protein B0H13DRAFT_1654230 [Mycena leptocephala]
MLASSGSQSTIAYFLRLNRLRSPLVIPRRIMSDFDWAQINACVEQYRTFILLCWWHVLHDWQKRFRITSNGDLWELLKWIRMTDRAEFDAAWTKIQEIAPEDFIVYLKRYWMPEKVVKMWSAIYRTPRSIFEECDMNMPIEAWHHVLKDKFLHGKRNRRLDHLINTLLHAVLPYYSLKQRRQDLGFEGPNVEVRKRQDIKKRSATYTRENIEVLGDGQYLVQSQSDPSKMYEVDIETYTCDCLDYPLISYCKHISAVQSLFDEEQEAAPYTPEVPSLASLPPEVPLPFESSTLTDHTVPKLKTLSVIAQKLEHVAARLRRPRKTAVLDDALANLEATLDTMLLTTDDSQVLPSAQRLAPVVKDTTARQSMMPRVKTRRPPAGDPAYGGGSSSGLKAKKAPSQPSQRCPAVAPPLPAPLLPQIPASSSNEQHRYHYSLPYSLPYQPTTTAPSYSPQPHAQYLSTYPHPNSSSMFYSQTYSPQ